MLKVLCAVAVLVGVGWGQTDDDWISKRARERSEKHVKDSLDNYFRDHNPKIQIVNSLPENSIRLGFVSAADSDIQDALDDLLEKASEEFPRTPIGVYVPDSTIFKGPGTVSLRMGGLLGFKMEHEILGIVFKYPDKDSSVTPGSAK